MSGVQGRARGTLALGAAVALVATGVLAWVAVSGDDDWHGGEPGVVLSPPATPDETPASSPSPLPTGSEPVFPTPQQTPGGAPTTTPGGGDPSPTDGGGAGSQQGTDAPASGSPGGGLQSGQPETGRGR